jgi:exopolysaccharide biosynthesis polyprenyl glycosylphosphotransferase
LRTFQNNQAQYRQRIVTSDLLIIAISMLVNLILLVRGELMDLEKNRLNFILVPALSLIWIFTLATRGAWGLRNLMKRRNLFNSVFEAGILTTFGFSFLAYVFKDPVSRMFVLINLLVVFVSLIGARFALHAYHMKNTFRKASQKIMRIRSKQKKLEVAPDFEQVFGEKFEVIDFFVEEHKEETFVQDLVNAMECSKANMVFVELGAIQNASILNEISRLHPVGVTDVIVESKLTLMSSRMKVIPGTDYLQISESALSDSGRAIKRMIDFAGSLFAIICLLPLFVITAVLIKLTSKGPVLYWSKRVGQDNSIINFPKFRSMYVGAEKDRKAVLGDDLQEIKNTYRTDPRITPFGRFIRRWSIDETPQFFSVLIGQMSLVGPRPVLMEEIDLIPSSFHFRFIAKPGLTGLWQISGRKEVDWIDRMHQDVAYVENWSLSNDILLILRTAGAILGGRGAY